MNIAITGASGHIGVNLAHMLHSRGNGLRVLIHRDEKGLESLPLEKVYGRMDDPHAIHDLVSGCDLVFHLAAVISIRKRTRGRNDDPNIAGTQTLLNVLRGRKNIRLVHCSSVHALNQDPYHKPLDESRPLALSANSWYSRSKAMCEKMVMEAVAKGCDALIINPTSILGPADYRPSLIGRFLIDLYRGHLPFLVPGGYNFIDVRDVIEGAWLAAQNGRTGERYLLSGSWRSLHEFSRIVKTIEGNACRVMMVPFWLANAGLPFVQACGWLKGRPSLYTRESLDIVKTSHRNVTSQKAISELGFHARSFEITVRDSIEWFRNNHYI